MESVSDTFLQALEHHRAGRLDQAEARYREVLRASRDEPNALHLLGLVSHQRHEHQRASELIRDAIRIKADFAPFHLNLGVAYRAMGRLDDAVECYCQAIELDSRCPNAHFNLGNVYKDLGRYDDAADSYKVAIELDPRNADAYNNLGDALKQMGRVEEAVECHSRAIAIRPKFAEAYFNLGNAWKRAGSPNEAESAYCKAAEIRPDYVEAHINLGYVLEEQARFPEAVSSYDRAIRLDAACADAHFNLSLALLRTGDFQRGWNEYEWRPARRTAQSRQCSPIWKGAPSSTSTILVRGEQGVGDEIMFSSLLPDLVRRCRRSVFECDARLVPLFQRSFPAVRVTSRNDISNRDASYEFDSQTIRADFEISLASLPKYLRPTLDSFPKRQRYLVPRPSAVAKWLSRVSLLGEGLKVGISWRGGNEPLVRAARSTTLDQWHGLLQNEHALFVNLQYGAAANEIARESANLGVPIHHWDDADPLVDLDDFAAQIAALDLVISIDNSTVHLAGALGVPTWVLLPFACDWRWLIDRNDTPWYQSVRLFRQSRAGDWHSVFASVIDALRKRLSAKFGQVSSKLSRVASV